MKSSPLVFVERSLAAMIAASLLGCVYTRAGHVETKNYAYYLQNNSSSVQLNGEFLYTVIFKSYH